MEVVVNESKSIPGLYYIPGLISEDQVEDLIEELDDEEWIPITSSENSRKVQHYGFTYNYFRGGSEASSKVGEPGEKTHPLPKFLHFLRDMLKELCVQEGIVGERYQFNQCIVNDYQPGQGISPHIDHKTYGHTIGCFTIGSPAMMSFNRVIYKSEGTVKLNKNINIYPLSGSLYIMSGECRNRWSHCMSGRKSDPNPAFVESKDPTKAKGQPKRIKRGRRISITFRNVPIFRK
ncbi:MAG: hypothetical protein S4CHLAM20_14730 [Chlamydiia bacterium]|nr:hypothetical protein [Chlamydiia bacterium]